jgi:acetyl-CoA carboxylase biotin carboxyl carrier protein
MSGERLLEDLQKLADQFLASGWTELRLKSGDTEILLSLDADTPGLGGAPRNQVSQQATEPNNDVALAVTSSASAMKTLGTDLVDPNWVPVVAPNLGTFYRSPKPGAPPFVEVGSSVTAGTEVCLIEVMKLFTSVTAGQSGTIAQICAADSELVAAGQVLFYLMYAED